MKKILVMLILVSCITLTACGPGTSDRYKFESYEEFIEILNGRFMFPTYYPEGYTITSTYDNVTAWRDFLTTYGFTIVNDEVNIHDVYYVKFISIIYIDDESYGYEAEMHRILRHSITDIRYHGNEKVFASEHIMPDGSYYDEELMDIAITYIFNSYLIYNDNIPYQFSFNVIINTTNEERVAALLPEINEMTYTEAMKMFDSLQSIE